MKDKDESKNEHIFKEENRKIYSINISNIQHRKKSWRHSHDHKQKPDDETQYLTIRMKKITYLDSPAVAIYFQNVT